MTRSSAGTIRLNPSTAPGISHLALADRRNLDPPGNSADAATPRLEEGAENGGLSRAIFPALLANAHWKLRKDAHAGPNWRYQNGCQLKCPAIPPLCCTTDLGFVAIVTRRRRLSGRGRVSCGAVAGTPPRCVLRFGHRRSQGDRRTPLSRPAHRQQFSADTERITVSDSALARRPHSQLHP